jgi:hypothetical protein
VKIIGRILLFPLRLAADIFNFAMLGKTPEDRKNYDQVVAEREARKRAERHGTP